MKKSLLNPKRALSEMLEPSRVGPLIKEHRLRQSLQQKDLAKMSGISQRHLSFIEQGKAVPSSETIISLAITLRVQPKLVNRMLIACGFAPKYDVDHLDRILSAPTTSAIEFTLANHDPLPAIIMDGFGTTLLMNSGAIRLVKFLTGRTPQKSDPPLNWVDTLCSDEFDRSIFINWDQIVVDSIKSMNSIYGTDNLPIAAQQAQAKLYATLDEQGKSLVTQPGMHPLPVYEVVLDIHGLESRWSITHLRFKTESVTGDSRTILLLWIPSDATSLSHAKAMFGL